MEAEDFLGALSESDGLLACPISLGFRLLGKRWTIEVVRQLYLGDSRFNDIIRHAEGINPRTLSLRLKELEENGLVSRSVSQDMPVSIEYSLTESGRETISVMLEMAAFMMKHFPQAVFIDGVQRTPEQLSEETGEGRGGRRLGPEPLPVV